MRCARQGSRHSPCGTAWSCAELKEKQDREQGGKGEPSPRVLGLEPVEQSILVEGSRGHHVALVELDVGDGVRVHHHLDQPRLVSCGEAAIRGHPAEMRETLPLKSCPQWLLVTLKLSLACPVSSLSPPGFPSPTDPAQLLPEHQTELLGAK